MSEQGNVKSKNLMNLLVLVVVIAAAVYFVSKNLEKSSSIVLSLAGLGVVIFVHEFGHFIAGKLSNINVEAFAIGFGSVVVGVKRMDKCLRFRILPTILLKDNDPEGEGLLCFKLPMNCKSGETEYQLRIFPLGGFVKLLGQEDVGSDKPSNDPRSFLNVPIWKRIAVSSAGVILNVVLAMIFFVVVFTAGIKMPPAIIGGCLPGYPAEKAGLKSGDEIISVDGKTNIDFSTVAMAGALSDTNEPVSMKVKRIDGSIEDLSIVAKEMPGVGYRGFGILPGGSLEIAKVANPADLFERTGLKAGDVLTEIDGEKIEYFWQYNDKLKGVFKPQAELTFSRTGEAEPVTREFEIDYSAALEYSEEGVFVPANIGGFVPRLKVVSVETADANKALKAGDVIVRASQVANPTYKELRDITTAFAGKELDMTVLRNDEIVEVAVTPRIGPDDRAVIGIGVGLDMENPVMASAADVNAAMFAELPRGIEIVSVAGQTVSSFFDIAAILEENRGKDIKIVYKYGLDEKRMNYTVSGSDDLTAVKAIISYDLPFKPLRKLYQADGALMAVKMGTRKTIEFIAQTYMTIKGLIVGNISPKSLMGPVGMIAASSQIIAEKDFIQYVHFMGIISACLAVMNFLPLPILDGGLVLLLIIEKIKGSPVNMKVQEWLTYAGLAIIGTLFVVITYNDIIRVFFR
ncbi:MAG: site-2 protease family protein [Phycisphaerae bacterium]|nr:site-2 protease family protein [Phycisphaerae bacterium]